MRRGRLGTGRRSRDSSCGRAGLIENAFREIETIVEQILKTPAKRSQTGSLRIQVLSAERGDLNWELPLGQTKSQRTVFRRELGFAFNIRVNDYAGVAIARRSVPAIRGSFRKYRRATHHRRSGADSLPSVDHSWQEVCKLFTEEDSFADVYEERAMPRGGCARQRLENAMIAAQEFTPSGSEIRSF
jgi:hypothetical protein